MRRRIVTVEASPRVEFFFSPGSRYSYLAASQMALLEAETGCTVDWRPVNGATFESFVVVIRSKASRFQGNTIGHTENAMRVSGPTTTVSDSESRRVITSISGSSPEPLRQPNGLAEPR